MSTGTTSLGTTKHRTKKNSAKQRFIEPVVVPALTLPLDKWWAILVVIFALLSGSFGVAFKLKDHIDQSTIEREKLENQKLKDQLKELQKEYEVEKARAEFKVLSTRTEKAEKELVKNATNKKLINAFREFITVEAKFLDQTVEAQKDDIGIPILRVVRSENPKDSSLQFRGGPGGIRVSEKVKALTREVVWVIDPSYNKRPHKREPPLLKCF